MKNHFKGEAPHLPFLWLSRGTVLCPLPSVSCLCPELPLRLSAKQIPPSGFPPNTTAMHDFSRRPSVAAVQYLPKTQFLPLSVSQVSTVLAEFHTQCDSGRPLPSLSFYHSLGGLRNSMYPSNQKAKWHLKC